jgi:hypothetical protein
MQTDQENGMDAKPSNATPTAAQAWWLTRVLAADPVPLYAPDYFNRGRLRSLRACLRRRWLTATQQSSGTLIVRAHHDATRDAFNRFIGEGP